MSAFDRAAVSLPDRPRYGQTPFGAPMVVHALAAETGGTFGAWDTHTPPGTGPLGHTHTYETEIFLVLDSTYHFVCGDDEFDAPPGTVVALPPHLPHKWWNIGTVPGRMMAGVAPGGCEQLFIDIATGNLRDRDTIVRIEARLGLVTDDSLALGLSDKPDPGRAPFPRAAVSFPDTARKPRMAAAAMASCT